YRSHRCHELITAPGHGDDEAPPGAAVTECAAQRRDDLVEVVLLDHDVRPDGRDECRLVEELPRVLKQEMQGVERLLRQLDRPTVSARGQPPLRRKESEVAELVDALSAAAFSHFSPASEGFRRSQGVPKPL